MMPTRILLIDKDEGLAEALGLYLKGNQFEVHTASSCNELLLLFDNIKTDIVMVDPGLPDTDLIYAVKQIKKSHPEVHIILLAEADQVDAVLEHLSSEASHYLPKPVKSKALDLVLRQTTQWIQVSRKLKQYDQRLGELENDQTLHQQLFNEVPCYISVQNRDFRLTATNRLFKNDFGDEIGSFCYEIYKHRTSPCRKCPVAATFEDGRTHSTEEIVTSKSGKQYHVMTWTAPIHDKSGRITQVMEMSTNITQIRQLQDHLTSLGLMIGSMSHGVKGMLTALDGGIYQLETGLQKNDRQRTLRAFDQVQQMTGRIRKMVLEILYYAKSRELNYQRVDAVALSEKIVASARPLAEKNAIALHVEIADRLGPIELDPNWMEAALVNFLENAVDACACNRGAKDHVVQFRVFKKSSERICFIIEDNGLGMDRETKEKMFTLFFTSKGSQGTGLGLFIANRVIRHHGGDIRVESTPQKGSRFEICLPMKRCDQPRRIDFPNHGKRKDRSGAPYDPGGAP